VKKSSCHLQFFSHLERTLFLSNNGIATDLSVRLDRTLRHGRQQSWFVFWGSWVRILAWRPILLTRFSLYRAIGLVLDSIHRLVCGYVDTRRWIESKRSPVALYNIHHRQNPFKSIKGFFISLSPRKMLRLYLKHLESYHDRFLPFLFPCTSL
jgi:hypothetical protein